MIFTGWAAATAVWLLFQYFLTGIDEGGIFILVIVHHGQGDVEIRKSFYSSFHPHLHIGPVIAFLVLWQQADEQILFVGRQSAGIHIGLIVQLLQYFFHPFPAGFGYSCAAMQYTVHCAD